MSFPDFNSRNFRRWRSESLCTLSLALLALLPGLSSDAGAQVFEKLVARSASVKDVRFPIGVDAARPSIILVCASAQLGRKQIGIFRFGLAPELVLADVDLRFQRDAQAGHWLADLQSFLSSEKILRDARMERLRFFDPAGTVILFARRALVVADGKRIVLEDFSCGPEKSHSGPLARGLLVLDGDQAGRILLPASLTSDIDSIDLPLPPR